MKELKLLYRRNKWVYGGALSYLSALLFFILAVLCNAIILGIREDIEALVEARAQRYATVLADKLAHDTVQAQVEALAHKYMTNYLQGYKIIVPDSLDDLPGPDQSMYQKNYREEYMLVEATAYWTHDPVEASGDGIAYDGTEAIPYQTCAVDPKVIPLQSDVFVPKIGWLRANDTGNAIKGKILDIAMPSRREAFNWGRRLVYIRVRIPVK